MVSVHRAAVYVEIEPARDVRRDLLVIALEDVGGVPGGILVRGTSDLRTAGIEPGMGVMSSVAGVGIPGAGLTIELSAARVWSPLLPTAARLGTTSAARGMTAEAAEAAEAARRLAADRAPAAGLGPLLSGDGKTDDPWLEAARLRIDRQRWAFGARDLASVLGEAVELIGLGPGLTPSGDDYLVGLLAGLEAAGHRSRPALATAIAHAAPSRTTAIGAATLAHAAGGAYAERLHDVLTAIAAGPGDRLGAAVERAMAYGATSGADTLVGLFAALDLMVADRDGAASAAGAGGPGGAAAAAAGAEAEAAA